MSVILASAKWTWMTGSRWILVYVIVNQVAVYCGDLQLGSCLLCQLTDVFPRRRGRTSQVELQYICVSTYRYHMRRVSSDQSPYQERR